MERLIRHFSANEYEDSCKRHKKGKFMFLNKRLEMKAESINVGFLIKCYCNYGLNMIM